MEKIFTQVGSSFILSWFVFFVTAGTLSLMAASVLKSRDTLLMVEPKLDKISKDLDHIKSLSVEVAVQDFRLTEVEKHVKECEKHVQRNGH